jgi:creatinine amidohydrolase
MRMGEMSWIDTRDAIAAGAAAIIPLGSIEEHGPHAPMGDYMVIDHIAKHTGEATNDLVAPTLTFGYSEYFRMYPGTITLRPEVLSGVVEDIIDCLLRHDVRRIAIFNGHHGNLPILELLTRKIRRERGLSIPTISPLHFMLHPSIVTEVYGEGFSLGHGGEPMGSVMMVLAPGTVNMDRAGAFGREKVLGLPSDGLGAIDLNGIRVAMPLDMSDVTPETGSMGDPAPATVERGTRLLEYAVERSIEFMRWFRTVDPQMGG